MSTGKVLLGTLAGIAIGALAGIVFAPEKGSKVRKKIIGKADDYVDDIKSKIDKISGSLTGKLESTNNKAKKKAKK